MTKRTQAPKAGGRREQLRQQAAAAEARRRQKRILLVGVAIVVAAALVVGVVVGVQALRGRANEVAGVTPPNANADNTGIIANPGVAPADAPVLTIYQDFQCPACKSFEDALGATVNEMAASGQVTVEHRTMTFLDRSLRNDASFRAGVAAACADVAGAYTDYYGVIYANQPASEGTGYSDDQLLTRFPEEAGLTGETLETFKSCYRGKDTAAFVRGTDAASTAAEVSSTPTIRVNGEDFDASQYYANPAAFAAAVEQAAA
ncbi:DsbA family protein [Auraticoccus monumenti]|uniref:Protein-disulfide isomerase n=1 Tax=Auraticoccus monumenti TaxID=675864 RepID=A0A1G7EQW8_9ACTN|nr:thioredoxin domain-containing protein [Auraticoccus monumenti]SDE66088.1 Protein-disulfide isomerase [Auraticoccus monumenti]